MDKILNHGGIDPQYTDDFRKTHSPIFTRVRNYTYQGNTSISF